LNEEAPIKSEDKNWDAEGEPKLLCRLELTAEEQASFERILSDLRATYLDEVNSLRLERDKAAISQNEQDGDDVEEAPAAPAITASKTTETAPRQSSTP